MIFCAITSTPCIVINSKSHKIKGCYKWLKHLDYIKFSDSISEIKSIYDTIPSKQFKYDNYPLKPYFEELSINLKKIRK